jgi:branched-chain amino acid transport system substrate-binding protein
MKRGSRLIMIMFLGIGLMLGFVRISVAAEPIVIGVPTALKQPEAIDSFRSAELAVEEINAKGGVLVGEVKRPFQIISLDTAEERPGIPIHDILAGVEKLVLEKKPHAIVVGAYRSESFLAQMDMIAKYKLPYLETISLTGSYEERMQKDPEKYRNIFRICLNVPTSIMYYTELLKFLNKEFGFNRILFTVQDILAFQQTAQAVQKWSKENGWEVVGYDAYPTGSSDFSTTLAKAKGLKAQIIFPIYYTAESSILLKQARSARTPAILVGYVGPATQENAWDVFEGQVEGLVDLCYSIGQIPVKAVPKSGEYNKAYGKKWGEDLRRKLVGHGPASGYDAVYILADAIRRAGTLDGNAIISALEKTDINGAIGRIRFNKNHQVVYGLDPKDTAVGCLFQWKKPGTRVPVFPLPIAEGKIELPSYMK